MIKRFLLLLFLLISLHSFAQKKINDRSLVWLGYFNQTQINNRWALWFDVHARRADFLDRWSALAARTGITYIVDKDLRITAGYALFEHYPRPGLSTVRPEHRGWQQIQWTHRAHRFQTQHRIRTEQRFNRQISNDALQDNYDFNHRLRYQLSFNIPLNKTKVEPGTLSLAFSDEILINAGKMITYNYFDQNRLFAGLSYQFSKSFNAQVGYMNIFQQLPSGQEFNNNHVLRIFLLQHLDLRAE